MIKETIIKAGGIILVTCMLQGCLATAAMLGAGLSTGVVAGCHNVSKNPNANLKTFESICGSAFKE